MATAAVTPGSAGGNGHGSVAVPDGGGVMRRLNIGTGIVSGVIVAAIFWAIFRPLLHSPWADDAVVNLTFLGWAIGFMVGIGAFTGPLRWAGGRDLTFEDREYMAGRGQGRSRYFKFCTDHKVVGWQYLVLGMTTLGIGGVMAMIIRTQLSRPDNHIVTPQAYNAIVGLHGIIMILSLSIIVTGPFGNFIMPMMIGARGMAFPRLNALSFWLLFAGVIVLLSAFFLGGIPTGWNVYAPLSLQGPAGMDAYLMGILLWALSSGIAAVNMIVTAITMRTKGMNWGRTPIFVWGVMATMVLSLLFFPAFQAAMVLLGLDRSIGTSFYDPNGGGSQWLYQNLFWLFGHPEVYIVLLPGAIAILEIAPVFARKPLFSHRVAVLGIVGITTLSALVWAHHMFTTGWAPALNGPFMLTTELISIPTGLLFLVILGTIWRGRIWTTVSMLFVYSFLWNFVIGGVTGVYLGDVPLNYQLHGSLFVTAHFHYTLIGGGLMGFFAAFYYWFPKMSGRMLNEFLGKVSFWLIQIGFNVVFLAMFFVGMQGQPRRVADYAPRFATGNGIATLGAYILGAGMLVFLWNVIVTVRRGEVAIGNPWGGKTLEWRTTTPVPLDDFAELPVVVSDPYTYGEPEPQPVPAIAGAAGAPGTAPPGPNPAASSGEAPS